MKGCFVSQWIGSAVRTAADYPLKRTAVHLAASCVLAACAGAVRNSAQVITIDTSGKGGVATAVTGPVDRRYAQIEPTHVALSRTGLDPKTRMLLIRALQSEQGFAMRPFPRGRKGLKLEANGRLDPAGPNYLNMVIAEGLSAKPGQRVVITNIRIDRSRIVFDFDGGPDPKHRFLRHIQIGMGPDLGDPDMDLDPSLLNSDGDPAGSRLTLTFADGVPELTPEQVKALIAPLVSFDVKSSVQAFTDTLPTTLKEAILDHKVLVGMTTDMVLFAKGIPNSKTREMDGQTPFEEWIYGKAPKEVDFVRINGNRVIRVEIARDGEPLKIFTTDVVTPLMMTTDNREVLAAATTRTVHEGDAQPDPDKQAPNAPPSLRNPGETLPTDDQRVGVMRPVEFPKTPQDPQPGANPDEQPGSAPATQSPPSQQTYPAYSQPGAQGSAPTAPNNSPPPAKTAPAPVGSPSLPPANEFLGDDS